MKSNNKCNDLEASSLERNYRDLITGTILLALSIVMFIGTFNIEALTDSQVGADFMPKVIAILIAVMSIPVLVNGFKKKKTVIIKEEVVVNDDDEIGTAVSETDENPDNKSSYIYLILTIILLFVYLFLIPVLGFLIATSAYLIIQMLLFSEWTIRNVILYGVISIITSSLVYFVFRNVFYVMLPSGIFG